MSISSVSGLSANSTQATSNQANFRQTFTDLVGALNSGNLSDAQQAYSVLSQLQNSGQGPSPNSSTPLAQALNQIGQDLKNGDVTGARQTLASLQQAQGGHHHHHGHHAHGADASSSSQTTPTPLLQGDTSTSSPNSINITV